MFDNALWIVVGYFVPMVLWYIFFAIGAAHEHSQLKSGHYITNPLTWGHVAIAIVVGLVPVANIIACGYVIVVFLSEIKVFKQMPK